MAESERFYKTLCSLETVRSEKKGFFRDFSEDVAQVAGEQWISKVFGRLTTDEERVRTIFTDGKIKDAVLETLNRTEILYRDKDAMASRARRLEGFEALAADEKRKALLLFSQAILRAPLPGKCKTVDRGLGLPLAFLARAEAFLTWNEYRFALEDLTFVEEMNHLLPNELRTMLARKKETCEKFLRASEKNLVSIEQDRRNGALVATEEKYVLKGGENPRLPGASILLDVEETVNAGKRVIAAKNIEPGDRLIIESPHAAILLPEFFGTHCQHCFSRFKAPIGCPDCSSVAFCGRKCRDAALASYHKYECKILVLLIGILHGLQRILSPDPHSERRSSVASSGSGMSVLSMLALRMATQVGPAGCLRIYRALNRQDSVIDGEEIAESSTITTTTEKLSKSAKRRSRRKKLRDSRRSKGEETVAERREIKGEEEEDEEKMVENMDLRVYDLVMHEKRRTAKDFFERSLMAAFLFKCLQKVGFFDNPSSNEEMPNDREIAVASLLLKHLQLLQFNAHEVFETRLGTEHRFRGSKPIYIGVAIYPTVARFNHDCYPAVTRYFLDRCIVIRATRSLQPGDVVAENYGPIFTKRNLEERRRNLAGRYWFFCECNACRENWPCLEIMTNDDVRLRCPTKGCSNIHQRPRNSSKSIFECSCCRRKIDLRKPLDHVRECEQLYTRGFEAMEKEQPEKALEAFFEATSKFHKIAMPPHKDTHLAEIAASACMADEGNVYRLDSFL